MKTLIDEFTFRVDLFEIVDQEYIYIKSIYPKLIFQSDKTVKESICEAIRKTLFNGKSSTKNKTITYHFNNCLAMISEYPTVSGYTNKNLPMLINNWSTYGVE